MKDHFDHVWIDNPMPISYTCSCGIHVHPSVINHEAFHIYDCPYKNDSGILHLFPDKKGHRIMNKHTQGNWEIFRETDGTRYVVAKDTTKILAFLDSGIPAEHVPPKEVEANAVLMAAAPKLLQACKDILEAFPKNKPFSARVEYCKTHAREAIVAATVMAGS